MLRFLARSSGYDSYCNITKSVLLRRMTESVFPKPVELSMRKKLEEKFNPVYMDVLNESYMHNVPKGSETHFKVIVVSDKFEDLPLIGRHRMIHELFSNELKSGVHALSIVAKTPSQWTESSKEVEPSPKCRGGFGK